MKYDFDLKFGVNWCKFVRHFIHPNPMFSVFYNFGVLTIFSVLISVSDPDPGSRYFKTILTGFLFFLSIFIFTVAKNYHLTNLLSYLNIWFYPQRMKQVNEYSYARHFNFFRFDRSQLPLLIKCYYFPFLDPDPYGHLRDPGSG